LLFHNTKKTVQWSAPNQVVKTVSVPSKSVQTVQVARTLPNPLVVQLQPSKTNVVRSQTLLTGSQLHSAPVVGDVVDESAKSDVVVQETENNYRK